MRERERKKAAQVAASSLYGDETAPSREEPFRNENTLPDRE
jgi:hypothetical protein